ncbi:MAG TPA: hypothetical protein VF495_23245 [Phenylobacterium sp.]
MRYYFHAEDGRCFHDEEGTELADDDAARIEATRVLGQLLNEDPMQIWRDAAFAIRVTDSEGAPLFTLQVVASSGPR